MRTIKLAGNVALPIPELRGKLGSMRYPAFGEIKYDGEFTFVIYDDGKICTVNKYNKLRTDFTELNQIKADVETKCTSAVLLAELYWGAGKRNQLYDLNSNKESDDLHLKIFDVIECDGVNISNKPLIDRKEALANLLPSHVVKTKVLNNKVDAGDFFKWTVDEGYEGAVIKALDSHLVTGPCSWVKMKMKDQSDYIVALIDQNKERIEVDVPVVNGNMKRVGVKAASRYKRHINVGDKVTIEHQGVLDSGSLRHPVLIPKKEWK